MKALVGAFNQEKALVGAFSMIIQPVVEPMEHYTALVLSLRGHLTSVLDVGGEAVLVLPEVLERGEVVAPAHVEHELDAGGQHQAAPRRAAHPRVLVRPVGHVQHVRRGLSVKPTIQIDK